MKILIYLSLVTFVASKSFNNERRHPLQDIPDLNITEDFFIDAFKIHTAENKIVQVHFPTNGLNQVNFNQVDQIKDDVVFFVEADDDGKTKGVSVIINDKVTHLVPTGTSVISGQGDNKITYIGATDGLYIYNTTLNKAEKYGTISDNIIDIALSWKNDDIYIVTDKNEVFQVTETGSKKKLIPEATGAKKISMTSDNELFFYVGQQLKVLTDKGVMEIKGVPELKELILLNPLTSALNGRTVPLVYNNKFYYAASFFDEGPSYAKIRFEKMPNDFSLEGMLVMLIAENMSIYKYNTVDVITTALGDSLPAYKQYQTTFFQAMADMFVDERAKRPFKWILHHKY